MGVSAIGRKRALGEEMTGKWAVTAAGQALCWGDNSQGQLGSAAVANVWTPAAVVGLTDAATITIGGDDDCPFTCATTSAPKIHGRGCCAFTARHRATP